MILFTLWIKYPFYERFNANITPIRANVGGGSSYDPIDLRARAIPPTNERGLLHHWHDRDNPSLWAAGSVFLDGPDHAEKS
jgi:hypothetical protein